jgi:hypothetical protein
LTNISYSDFTGLFNFSEDPTDLANAPVYSNETLHGQTLISKLLDLQLPGQEILNSIHSCSILSS